MTTCTVRWTRVICAVALAAICCPTATASSATQAIIKAVRHGDCDKAIKAINDSVNSSDAQIDALAGRMINEGICVKRDSAAATDYFKRALELGDRGSAFEYGAKIGLGEGAPQSYEHAGEVCRAGGLDAAGQLSTYALGYACTVRTLAGQLLRNNVPLGAFVDSVAVVRFTPADASMQIRSTPKVGRGEADLGSNVRRPMIDAQAEIDKAWKQALTSVPKPDPARLDNKSIDLPVDVEMTVEKGKESAVKAKSGVLQGEIIPSWRSM